MSGAGPNTEQPGMPPKQPMPADVIALVRDLTDPDACHFDHHGYCQAHGWMATRPRCPHVRAREFLARYPEATL